jgi:hypothetical protein
MRPHPPLAAAACVVIGIGLGAGAAPLALPRSSFAGIDAGLLGNLVGKPVMVRGLQAWQREVTCRP